MSAGRNLASVIEAEPSVDGAGVTLKRVFGFGERNSFDPFLLLDHFGSDNPKDYLAGFPWHPHRGIETVTYLLAGKVAHGDSMGNKGIIGPGDAQWMTAGSGIIHQEMPEPGADGKLMEGFQLWVNLPANLKMTEPRYRAIEAGEIPRFRQDGCEIAILAGEYGGMRGATPDLFIPVLYLIVTLNPGATIRIPVPASHNAAAYVFRGKADFAGTVIDQGKLGHFPASPSPSTEKFDDDFVEISSASDTSASGTSFLFIAGQPLKEPIAWGGPIVMNTREELRKAFAEFDSGTFIKQKAGGA
ncbi:MAG: pirin family protein [Rectinemataceae bacterium]|nr:pirin family protein [Rectinemataceae bacterium]